MEYHVEYFALSQDVWQQLLWQKGLLLKEEKRLGRLLAIRSDWKAGLASILCIFWKKFRSYKKENWSKSLIPVMSLANQLGENSCLFQLPLLPLHIVLSSIGYHLFFFQRIAMRGSYSYCCFAWHRCLTSQAASLMLSLVSGGYGLFSFLPVVKRLSVQRIPWE